MIYVSFLTLAKKFWVRLSEVKLEILLILDIVDGVIIKIFVAKEAKNEKVFNKIKRDRFIYSGRG